MPKEEKNTTKKPRITKSAKKSAPIECHIHDRVGDWLTEDIRENVCVATDEYDLTEFGGKHYCLFHLPTQDKDIERFEKIFLARIEKTDQICAEIEAEFPEDEEKQSVGKYERNIIYDFRYVWFPQYVDLSNHKFTTHISFALATFSDDVYFTNTIFGDVTNFTHVTFLGIVHFDDTQFEGDSFFRQSEFYLPCYVRGAIFQQAALFDRVKFKSGGNFESSTFNGDSFFNGVVFTDSITFRSVTFSSFVSFNSTKFPEWTNFNSAKFLDGSSFKQAKFSKTGETSFNQATFEKNNYFHRARFRNNTDFSSVNFSNDSDIFIRKAFFAKNADFRYCTSKGYLRFEKLRQGKENKFDFQEAAFEKATRISFHTCRLQPNWFVNIDSRKFVFTDINWENIDWKEKRNFREKFKFAINCAKSGWRQLRGKTDENVCENITKELEKLDERGIKDQKKRLLEIACRQLAVNAEENNRYEEASKFRYMAMETKRLENKGVWRFLNLHWFYKWSSGYGESWARAAVVLLGILLLFAVFYTTPFANFDFGEKKREIAGDAVDKQMDEVLADAERFRSLTWDESIVHSLSVAALQRPEPKAEGTLTRFFIISETIFAPLQAALLALAIRRKFMR